MSNQYKYCSKCGTRNFVEDDICGACKSKLDFTSSRKTNYWIPILIISGILIFFYTLNTQDKEIVKSTPEVPSVDYQNLPDYKILKTTLNNKIAFNVKVGINEKLTNSQLKAIAQKVLLDILKLLSFPNYLYRPVYDFEFLV